MRSLYPILALAACSSPSPPVERAPAIPSPPPTAVATRAATAVALPAPEREAIDAAVAGAIERGEIPGAVVIVLRDSEVVFEKAYGLRAPGEAMTADTVFDLASLTKPIVTATAVMLLVQEGKLSLDDPVAKHLPAFAAHGKSRITVRQLLGHTSGLPAANSLSDYRGGPARAIERLLALPAASDAKRVYSDVGYLVLGALVERIAGEPLDRFAERRILEPLGMNDAVFRPAGARLPRAAPTQDGRRGRVHDPRADALGGVAGHAGLFATARDVARYCAMLLGRGTLGPRALLHRDSVAALVEPAPTGHALAFMRAAGGFGHTGFTGTSFWIEPRRGIALVVLTSRLQRQGGDAAPLRAALRDAVLRDGPVLAGIDVLALDGFAALRGRRVGLVTNATGRTRGGRSTIDVLHAAPEVRLVALFSPEHGLRGELDRAVPDAVDARTGLVIHSLYGKTLRPSAAQLRGIDTLVYDVQDAGVRFYTYATTLGYLLEAAAEHALRVVVLDRPNPLGGVAIEGPLLDADRESFIGYHPLPVRHGMTVGELARLFNAERRIGADLQVIAMRGYTRRQLFDDTGLPWVNPSPNLRSAHAALLYPGVGLLEATNLSVGRGTETPFELVGAPWLDAERLARDVGRLPGLRVTPTRFTPRTSTFANRPCAGLRLEVTDPHRFEPLRLGITMAHALVVHHPEWRPQRMLQHLGSRRALEALVRGERPDTILASFAKAAAAFERRRSAYLLY